MRIRKNAKLSPLLFSSSSSSQGGSVPVETFQTHVCQLNQSPWDVIPFDSDSIQFECENSFTNGSAGDSIGAVESVASMLDIEDKVKIEDMTMMVVDNDNNLHGKKVAMNNKAHKGVVKNSCCKSLDEKGFPCKNGTKQGQSFCDHHFRYGNGNGNNGKKVPATAAAGTRRARPRTTKKVPSSNPYEFYYYSGFGPLWGKRRGDKNGGGSKNSIGGVENSTMEEPDNVIAAEEAAPIVDDVDNNWQNVVSPSNEGFDYVDDDDEEEEDDNNDDDNGKKRMRKPVKARSLKSLM